MDFSSDTSAPAHPNVLKAMMAANAGSAASYGNDEVTARVRHQLERVLGTDDFDVWMCASGTASNALALSVMCSPTAAILCHEEAHIERDERGAPEFFTGGGKLQLLPGAGGRIDEAALRGALARIDHDFVHETPAEVLSLTNLTECGTAYSIEMIAHFSALAHEAGLSVHLDGARLANAVISQNARVADMVAPVDVVTLGLTKTGAIGCEIIILKGENRRKSMELRARAKRSGHMPPKMRYLAAQAEAMLADDLWLSLARDANAKARQVSNILCAQDGVTLAYPTDGNEVFAVLPDALVAKLTAAGAKFYPWPGGSHRFVCSWATPESDLDDLRRVLAG